MDGQKLHRFDIATYLHQIRTCIRKLFPVMKLSVFSMPQNQTSEHLVEIFDRVLKDTHVTQFKTMLVCFFLDHKEIVR